MINEHMNIVVLAAGTSSARDVSIVSGTGVCRALRERGHRAILVDVFFGIDTVDWDDPFPAVYDIGSAAARMHEDSQHLEEAMRSRREFFGTNVISLCKKADVTFLALHGANGEDGRLQAAFDLLGIKYTGTGYLSSALAMDKKMTKQCLQAAGIPVPGGITLVKGKFDEIPLPGTYGMDYPIVVKPCCGGSSVGTSIVFSEPEYMDALKESFALEPEAVIEPYIGGREFSVAVIGDEAYPIIEIAPIQGFYDYKNKYSAGAVIETCPAELSEEKTREMQELAVRGAEALGITGYCRFDFLMNKKGELFALEANTLPGMTPTSLVPQEAAALGISYPELCELLIEKSFE